MKEKMIVFAFFAVLIGLMVCLLPFALPPFLKWKLAVFVLGEAILGTVLLAMFFGGLTTLGQEERAIVEVLGAFSHVAGPGLTWICPRFMSIRAVVSTWEQSFQIFNDCNVWIDFVDGRARPKLTVVSVRAMSPDVAYSDNPRDPNSEKLPGAYRTIYLVDNWRDRGVEQTENAVRTYLATIELDKALEKGKAGFDLLAPGRMPKKETKKLRATFARWGLEILKITIGDFDLPTEVLETRDDVQRATWRAEAAKAEMAQVARETTGTYIHMIAHLTGETPEDVQDRFAANEDMEEGGRAFAQELVSRQLSLRHNALRDVRAATGSPLGDTMALASEFFSRRQDPNPQPGALPPTRNANPNPAPVPT